MHDSLKGNELLLPVPFSRRELCLYSLFLRYSAKKYQFQDKSPLNDSVFNTAIFRKRHQNDQF